MLGYKHVLVLSVAVVAGPGTGLVVKHVATLVIESEMIVAVLAVVTVLCSFEIVVGMMVPGFDIVMVIVIGVDSLVLDGTVVLGKVALEFAVETVLEVSMKELHGVILSECIAQLMTVS